MTDEFLRALNGTEPPAPDTETERLRRLIADADLNDFVAELTDQPRPRSGAAVDRFVKSLSETEIAYESLGVQLPLRRFQHGMRVLKQGTTRDRNDDVVKAKLVEFEKPGTVRYAIVYRDNRPGVIFATNDLSAAARRVQLVGRLAKEPDLSTGNKGPSESGAML
jgi:hypothetical protein